MKYNRWLSLFYAKLLFMLIHWQIYHLVKQAKYRQQNNLLSINKSLRSLKLAAQKITLLIKKGITNFRKTIQELSLLLATKHDLEKKKGSKNQHEIIEIIYCLSGNQMYI